MQIYKCMLPMNNKMKLKYCAKSGRVTEAQTMNFDRHNYVMYIKTEVMMLVAGGLSNFKEGHLVFICHSNVYPVTLDRSKITMTMTYDKKN